MTYYFVYRRKISWHCAVKSAILKFHRFRYNEWRRPQHRGVENWEIIVMVVICGTHSTPHELRTVMKASPIAVGTHRKQQATHTA